MSIEQLVQEWRGKICAWWTKGAHDFKEEPTRFKCRICGFVKEKPAPPPVDPPAPPQPDPDPEPNPDPSGEPNPANPAAYRAGFLWKPVAAGGGPLVVLCPPGFTGHIYAFWIEHNGNRVETGTGAGVFNGGRYHVRYSKPGGSYPDGAEFCVLTDAQRLWKWRIPNTSARYDGQITPTVSQSLNGRRWCAERGVSARQVFCQDRPEPGEES